MHRPLEMKRSQAAVKLAHPASVGEARRAVAALTEPLALGSTERGKLALLVTEACGNVIRHGGGDGLVMARSEQQGDNVAVELVIIDRGGGMSDVNRCLRDGYSTVGGAGLGLGAMLRLADAFDVYSQPGRGAAVALRLQTGAAQTALAALNLPLAGQTVSGDNWEYVPLDHGRCRLMVADGLGHGPQAAIASEAAVACLRRFPDLPLDTLLERMSRLLASTRGAAAAIAEIDTRAASLCYAGVGNIAGQLVEGETMHGLASTNGTLGAHMPRVRVGHHSWTRPAVLVMHSDGIGSRWRPQMYPGLFGHSAATIAGVLLRDQARPRDDATVCVLRLAAPSVS